MTRRWTTGARLAAFLCAFAIATACAETEPSHRRTSGAVTPNDAAARGGTPAPQRTNAPKAGGAPGAGGSPGQGGGAAAHAFVANPQRCAEVRARQRSNPPLYSETSIFNTPAACLELHPQSQSWASRWFNFANYPGRTDPAQRGAIDVAFDDYSTPIYDAADATGWIKVYHPSWAWASDLGPDSMIPWNPSWRPAPGNDHEMTIVDHHNGIEWGLWGVMIDNPTECWTLENFAKGYRIGQDLCVWVGHIGYNTDGTLADGRSGDGYSLKGDRGMGRLLSRTLLPTLDEIERGSINHAVNMETYATMFGPGCTAAQVSAGKAGTDCGYAVAPATRLELENGPLQCGNATQPATPEGRAKSIPEGMRFVLNKTDAEIESWLDSRGYVGAKRNTARIFAVALRDYGWIISDSSCWNSSMAVEGVANPKARNRWAKLGITNPAADGASLLDGLISGPQDVITLKPNLDKLYTTVHG